MTAENGIATFAALVAVVGLWAQIRSMRAQLTVQNFSHYNERYQRAVASFPPSVLAPDFDLAALPAEEQLALGRAFWYYFDLCLEEYHLYRQGLVSADVWRMWESGMRAAMTRTAFRQGWAQVNAVTSYAEFPGFVELMDGFARSAPGRPAN
ncbi:hypothetical protein ABZ883_24420 [Streptomyces sp. NPDC046977]|uniref:hypothetical protein n=1 Tax=Streptomyces sp. NPDC046977 TaxID=3154703 RepID=UPI003405E5EB